jgi:hypothetical protein
VEVKGIVDGQELYWGYSADVSYQLNLNPFLIEVNPPSSFLITPLSL